MNTVTKAIVEQAAKFSANEKIELFDIFWASEAESRLSAYQKGEIQALDLNQVLVKHHIKN